MAEHDGAACPELLRGVRDAELFAAGVQVSGRVHEVVRELGEGQGVAHRLLQRLLPVRNALHARDGPGTPGNGLLVDEARQFPDSEVGDGVRERARYRDRHALVRHVNIFACACHPELARLRLRGVLPPDSGRVRLRAGRVRPVGHHDERARDPTRAIRGAQLRGGVLPDILSRLAQFGQRGLPGEQRLFAQLRDGDVPASEQRERVLRLPERPLRDGEPRRGLRRGRRHFLPDAEGLEHVRSLRAADAVRVPHVAPPEAREDLLGAYSVCARGIRSEGDGRHDVAHVFRHVLRHGLREVFVKARQRLAPLLRACPFDGLDELDDVDEAWARQGQPSPAVFFRAVRLASVTRREYSASSFL